VNEPSAFPAAPALVRLPDPAALFERRAARLAALAEGHAAPEWLRLLARIARGQARAVREVPLRAPRGGRDDSLSPTGREGPGEGASRLTPRDPAWRRMLAVIVDAAHAPGLPAPARDALSLLASEEDDRLEALADVVQSGAVAPDLVACAPFVGAALQAARAALAAGLAPAAPGAAEREGACPGCGGPPVAGVIGAEDRLRWLSCARCATEWNVPRVRCTACETSASPEYLHVDADPGAKAEACPDCRTYLKLFDLAKRPGAEPGADDAATIALDLLLAEQGFHRAAANPLVGA